MLTQNAVDAAALCGRQRERGVGREDDLRDRDAEVRERLAAVPQPYICTLQPQRRAMRIVPR